MRYAIYFMPHANSALWHFGSSVLGYDAATGQSLPLPGHPALAALPLADWTGEPRRYGFHATLKAPFTLAEGYGENELLDHARSFAAARNAFEEQALALVSFSGFVALALAQASQDVTALANDCVISFDRFRAPLTPEDRARRLAHPLPARQMAQLERWGYPLVFEDFTFHMTLSNQLERQHNAQLHAALALAYAPLAAPVRFDAIAVFVQPTFEARFTLLQRFEFGT